VLKVFYKTIILQGRIVYETNFGDNFFSFSERNSPESDRFLPTKAREDICLGLGH
jgi:hypothetical protein